MTIRAIAALMILAAAAEAQAPTASLSLRPGMLAVTGCRDGRPLTLFAPDLDSLTAREIEAHEAVHRRQLMGDCESRLRAIKADPYLGVDAEAEAICEQLRGREVLARYCRVQILTLDASP